MATKGPDPLHSAPLLPASEEDRRPIPSMPGVRAPYRIDGERLRREVLEPLRSGLSAQFVHRDWWYAEQAEVRIVPSQGIVLVGGTRTLHRRLRDLYDEWIFLECAQGLALERALARDIPPGEDEVGELAWKEVHSPAEWASIREQNPRVAAHVVVDSSQPIGPEGFVTLAEGSR